MTVGNVFFLVAGAVALLGALMTVASRSPIRSAVGLLINIVGIAALFLQLNAQFLAAIQLIVYAGAVVVLFVFVIMLLGPDAGAGEQVGRARLARYGAGAFFVLLAAGAGHLVSRAGIRPTHFHKLPDGYGSVEALGTLLFGSDAIPFELTTALLLVAVVGAIAVARGKPHVRRESKSASPTARMFHGPLMARDAQRPLPTKAQKAAAKAAGGM